MQYFANELILPVGFRANKPVRRITRSGQRMLMERDIDD
jgi:hypothetical protein